MEGGKALPLRREAVRQISLGVTAQRRDIEWRVVQQIFQLLGKLRTLRCAVRWGHLTQIEIVGCLYIRVRVASF